jgi:pimeloyl-ACP methyl ester carboxylesterase
VGWREGSGPPVLVLHGGPGLSDYTEPLADELVDSYTVYRYQQRGLAPSSTEGPFTVDAHISDVIAVLEAIGEQRVWLIGHSWGGHLALHFACAHPDRLLGLVVIDPLGVLGDGGISDMEARMGERMTPESVVRRHEMEQRAMRGEGRPGDALEAFSLVWPTYFADPEHAPPMPPIEMSVPCYAETFVSIREELARQTLPPLLHSFSAPCVFVLGADSPIPTHHGEVTAALIPNAAIEIAEGCGHFPWLERPGVVRAALDSITAGA